jgi:hypothetical protein
VDHLALTEFVLSVEALDISEGNVNIQRVWKVIRDNMTILARESSVLKQQTI